MQSLACRVYFGPDAIDSTPGRMFVLFGEILQCMGHHVLEWYGEKRIKHWRKERQKCCDVKDRDGIKHAQEMMISWRHYLRVLQGIVHNFCDEEPGESAADRLRRYQDCSLIVSAVIQVTGRKFTMELLMNYQMKTLWRTM